MTHRPKQNASAEHDALDALRSLAPLSQLNYRSRGKAATNLLTAVPVLVLCVYFRAVAHGLAFFTKAREATTVTRTH